MCLQAAAFDAQYNVRLLVLNIILLNNTSIGIKYPNSGVQFNKWEHQGCAEYT